MRLDVDLVKALLEKVEAVDSCGERIVLRM